MSLPLQNRTILSAYCQHIVNILLGQKKAFFIWLLLLCLLCQFPHSGFDTESSAAENCKKVVYFPELPRPNLGDLSDMRAASVRLRRERTPNVLGFSFSDLCSLDNVKVELVPEKKGLILKHVEYEVTSQRFKSTVLRRYNDFVALYDMVVMRFPYRILPKLPPKKMLGGKVVVLFLHLYLWINL